MYSFVKKSLLAAVVVLIACTPASDFKSVSIELRDIYLAASNLAKPTSAKNTATGTTVVLNIENARDYLEQKADRINALLTTLEGIVVQKDKASVDAFFTKTFFSLSSKSYGLGDARSLEEDIQRIESNSSSLSTWVIDEVYGKTVHNNGFYDQWEQMPTDVKVSELIGVLRSLNEVVTRS